MSEPARLTLTDLESYRNQGSGKRSGQYLRYYCPIHGGDHQRSLSLSHESGRFQCFACGAWGYLEEKRQEWLEVKRQEWLDAHKRNGQGKYTRGAPIVSSPVTATLKPPVVSETVQEEPKADPELFGLLAQLQQALPGSLGEKYLGKRRIPLKLAQSFGAGYAAYGKWPHTKDGKPVRQWKWGRVVFPHTNLAGGVVNLYGRAVENGDPVPKELQHDHLPLSKGVFNAKALLAETVFICEGVFNALSLIAAGYRDACAIFGVYGLRWDWVKAKRIVFCMDQDKAGEHWREFAWEGIMRDFEIYWLPAEVYQGYKDLNEVWMSTGKLSIGEWQKIKL